MYNGLEEGGKKKRTGVLEGTIARQNDDLKSVTMEIGRNVKICEMPRWRNDKLGMGSGKERGHGGEI